MSACGGQGPPSALDFVLVLVFGLRYTPALWLNTFVHEYFVTHHQLNFVTLGIFDLVTTLGYVGASALLLFINRYEFGVAI